MTTPRTTIPPADTCRANGWGVGTRLVGSDPKSTHPRIDTVRITAIGEQRVLVVWESTKHETDLPLTREWVEVL